MNEKICLRQVQKKPSYKQETVKLTKMFNYAL